MNVLLLTVLISTVKCFDLSIDRYNPAAVVDSRFLSVTIDSSNLKNKFRSTQFSKLLPLARGLTGNSLRPEFFLRVGGTNADDILFNTLPSSFNSTDFEQLVQFVYELRWVLIFDLNSLLRFKDGSWNPENAIELIEYVTKEGYFIHYELGNEPDLYPTHRNITVSPEQLAHDFKKLRKILDQITRRQSILIGPDVATLTRYDYFAKFLQVVEEGVLQAVTFHHYYSSSDHITTSNFTNPSYLDEFLKYTQRAWNLIRTSIFNYPIPQVWIGETSSTYGGGSEIGESFAAGFLWLDKLGLAAQLNISVVFRQELRGGHYSLINRDYQPNPDYWISLLHKQLVGQIVLNVTGFLQYNREIRVYAHCINRFGGRGYEPNQIVLMILNLNKQNPVKVAFQDKALQHLLVDNYLFSPSNGQLDDKLVNLNGVALEMIHDTSLPELKPVRLKQPIIVPPLQYGFFVLVGSYAKACSK